MLTAYSLSVDGLHRQTADGLQLRFRWRLRGKRPGANQGAFRITIGQSQSLSAGTGKTWTSGWIETDEVALEETIPLAAGDSYVAALEIRDDLGEDGTGESLCFITGPDIDTWSAAWIGRNPEPAAAGTNVGVPLDLGRSWQTMYSQPALQLRRSFILAEIPIFGVLHVSARGVHRSLVNGTRVSDHELAPGWTDYQTRIEVDSHDVTSLLRKGENVLAAEVSDGWWSGYLGFDTRNHAQQYGVAPQFTATLDLTFEDGSRKRIESDGEWTEQPGHIVVADLLMGEYHDLGLETLGWSGPGYDSSGWRPAVVLAQDTSMLAVASGPRVRELDVLSAVSVTANGDAWVADFGQNLVGRVRIRLRDQKVGTIVRIRHGEMLDGDSVYTANLRTAEATDIVAIGASGEGEIEFEPRHTVHGFRYASIEGVAGGITADDVEAIVIGSDLPTTGSFESSSSLINQLYSNIRWGQRGNFVSVPTDCPQRDERLGWTADTQIFAPTALFNSDASTFLERWLIDLRSAQRTDGSVPDVIPVPPSTSIFDWGAPAWGDAAVLVPWAIYRAGGDVKVLEDSLESMRLWSDYVAERAPEGVWDARLGNNYGDWLSVDADTSKTLVATAYFARVSELAGRAADAVGALSLAETFRERAERARAGFQNTFVVSTGLAEPTQTGCLMALAWDLLPEELVPFVLGQLVEDLEGRDRRLTTGFLGVALLCPVLAEHGRADLAYAVLLQEEYPSWGYSIKHGATTIWERWDGWTEHRGFQTVAMNSFNHYSLGSVGEWLYRGAAGIDQASDDAGFRELRIRPHFTDKLERVSAGFESTRGLIRSEWARNEQSGVELSVEVPPGCRATVVLPGEEIQVGSGSHVFTFALPLVDAPVQQ